MKSASELEHKAVAEVGLQVSNLPPQKPPPVMLTEEQMLRMVDSMTIMPVKRWCDHDPEWKDNQMSLRFGYQPGAIASGVPAERLYGTEPIERNPRFRVALDDSFRNTIGQRSIYGGDRKLWEYLDLSITDGKIMLGLHRILANPKHVGNLTPAVEARLQEKACELIQARDVLYAPKYQIELDKKADAALAANAEKAPATQKKVALQASATKLKSATILDEMALLQTDGNKITLPEIMLGHYAEIKKRILLAGGEYDSDKTGSFFAFAPGIDAHRMLQGLQCGEVVNIQQKTQFFATPPEVADRALATVRMDVRDKRVLEPSAGDGALADLLRSQGADVIAIENWDVNCLALRAKGYAPIEKDFLQVSPPDIGGLVSVVVMNPPFSKGQDMAHVRHALGFIKPEGELTAIISTSYQNPGKRKDANSFLELLALAKADEQQVEAGAFNASGTNVCTTIIHIEMLKLLQALQERSESGKEYGLDLDAAWKEFGANAAKNSSPRI